MNELAKSIADLINSLNGGAKSAAETLARVAPDAWHALVWRVQVEAWTHAVAFTLSTAVALYFARRLLRYAKTDEAVTADNDTSARIFALVLCVVAAIAAAHTATCAPDLIAPEVTAAERLLRAVKP